jgi:hypothetical protein
MDKDKKQPVVHDSRGQAKERKKKAKKLILYRTKMSGFEIS